MSSNFIKLLRSKLKARGSSSGGFSLVELLITLGIFGILMALVTNIIVINLKAARRIKARSYAREESSFMLNVLKKDVRNAEEVTDLGGNEILIKIVDDVGGVPTTNCYRWFQSGNIIEREKIDGCTGSSSTSYRTPSDVTFQNLTFQVFSSIDNWVVKMSVQSWTTGMPDSPRQWITKEVAVSTRNFAF
jgi:prepilin-type N-terminal cleavage/methylation domain-containing protein